MPSEEREGQGRAGEAGRRGGDAARPIAPGGDLEGVAARDAARAREHLMERLGAGRPGGGHRGRGPRGWQRSDERIHEEVCQRLAEDPWLDAEAIEVAVSGGEVRLAGEVRDRRDRRRAEDLAEAVAGVLHVQNDLRPRAPGSGPEEDARPGPSDNLDYGGYPRALLQGGSPTRDYGHLDLPETFGPGGRIDAGGYPRGMLGRGEEAPRPGGGFRGRGPRGYARPDPRVLEEVNDRLTDDDWLDATDIAVRVEGGEVTLEGMVRSRADRRRAEDIADAVSGVRHVQNNLRVREGTQGGG